jgi:hypothetical protein
MLVIGASEEDQRQTLCSYLSTTAGEQTWTGCEEDECSTVIDSSTQ